MGRWTNVVAFFAAAYLFSGYAEALDNPGFWGKYNGVYDTGRGYQLGVDRGNAAVDPNSGSYTYSWALPLPAGRRGVAPQVVLSYSSQGREELLGRGWMLSMARIERDVSFGPPSYNNDLDMLVFYDDEGGAYPLTPVYSDAIENRFRLPREGEWIKFRYLKKATPHSKWIVLFRNGQAWTFDSVAGPSESQVFAWYLSLKEDRFFNYASYTYLDPSRERAESAAVTGVFAPAISWLQSYLR
jgi:hypothetical protein